MLRHLSCWSNPSQGNLVIQKENGELRLDFEQMGLIQGGTIDPDGDLTSAKVLFRQLFETWRMSDMTLTAKLNS